MSASADGLPLSSPSSFNDAEKIQNFLSIGDSCHFAAQYLEDELLTALDPITGAGNNLSRSKRASLCANLKIIIKSLTMAHDLSYASSSRLSHTRQEKKAHSICAREAKRQRKELERRSVKQTKKKHASIPFLEQFNSKVFASLSCDFSSGDESAGGEESSIFAPAPRKTRSVESVLGWMERLPPLQPGYHQYSPKEAIDFVIREIDRIDQARESGAKGMKGMESDLLAAKQ